jgi:hypothetical protein
LRDTRPTTIDDNGRNDIMARRTLREIAEENRRVARVRVRGLEKTHAKNVDAVAASEGKLARAKALLEAAERHPDLGSDEERPAPAVDGLPANGHPIPSDEGGPLASDEEGGVAGRASDEDELPKDEDGKPVENKADVDDVDEEPLLDDEVAGDDEEPADGFTSTGGVTSGQTPEHTNPIISGH